MMLPIIFEWLLSPVISVMATRSNDKYNIVMALAEILLWYIVWNNYDDDDNNNDDDNIVDGDDNDDVIVDGNDRVYIW